MKHFKSPPSEKRSAVVISQDGKIQECIDIDNPGANEFNFSQRNKRATDNLLYDKKYRSRFTTWFRLSIIILVAAVATYIYIGTPIDSIPKSTQFVVNRIDNEIQESIEKLKQKAAFIIEDNQSKIESPTIEKDFSEIFKAISTDIATAEVEKKKTIETGGKVLSKKIRRSNTKGFSEFDVNYLLGQYAITYEFGNTDRIMGYFSVNINNRYKRQLTKSFNKVFSYSKHRHIAFSDLKWTFYKNSIIGNGKYKAKLELKNHRGTRFIDAKIKLKMRVKSNQLRIAKLKFSNVKVNLVPDNTKALPIATTKRIVSKPKVAEQPTAEELRDVVARFVNAYESGNLTALNAIFSKNAITNDSIDLIGIKRDYMSLFSTTTDRRLIIEGLNWSYRNNQAQGIGRLSVLIMRKGSNKLSSEYGKIQIAAEKSDNKVTITRLFHNFKKNSPNPQKK